MSERIAGIELLDAPPRHQTLADNAMRLWAPAKINLNLLVGLRGADGYHPLDSLVCKLALTDELELRTRRDGEIRLDCAGADCGPSERNLAVRAARLMRQAFRDHAQTAEARGEAARSSPGVDIRLMKRIPPGAGLGGGSSDGAAVLWGLDKLWNLNLGSQRLADLAAELGSDVPLFLGEPCSRMTGRGERLTEVRIADFLVLLILPPMECSTAEVYSQFDASPPRPLQQLAPERLAEPVPSWRGELVNQLGRAARKVCPSLGRLWDELSSALPFPVHLSGSGSSLFVLCQDREELARAISSLPTHVRDWVVPCRRSPW